MTQKWGFGFDPILNCLVPDPSRFFEGSGTLFFPSFSSAVEPDRCGSGHVSVSSKSNNCGYPIRSLLVKNRTLCKQVNQHTISPQRPSHFAFKRIL
jgi:hypothetical protein